ncbi:MAG: hypothetical protein AAB553_00365 [Patescibacteria group bacterium]
MKKFFSHKIVKWVLVPLLLLLFWLVFTLKLINETSGITMFVYPYGRSDFTSWKDTELLKGQKVAGEFQSSANNLGIIAVRFNTYQRINKDALLFSIKEKGKEEWYYTNTYLVNQFQPDQFFTFGFPIIEKSEGKIYQFVLESQRGKPNDAVSLSTIEPAFVTKHAYTKQSLFSDKDTLVEFFAKKSGNLFAEKDFITTSLSYLLPLIFYLIWQNFSLSSVVFARSATARKVQERLQNSRSVKNMVRYFYQLTIVTKHILILPILFVLFDVFFVQKVSHITILALTVIWLFIVKKFHLESKVSFLVAFFLLAFCPILLIINWIHVAEKAAMWSYVFLLIGVVQQIFALRIKEE